MLAFRNRPAIAFGVAPPNTNRRQPTDSAQTIRTESQFDAATRKEVHEHDLEMQRLQHAQERSAAQQEHDLKLLDAKNVADVDRMKANNGVLLEFLGSLKGMNVDLTQYLCSMGEIRQGNKDVRAQVAQAAGLDVATALAAMSAHKGHVLSTSTL